ncbi:MAG: sigma-70 family RNA polymerase sigma factor, partial [Acidobacteriota bacterium]
MSREHQDGPPEAGPSRRAATREPASPPSEMERVRRTIARAVVRICPSWLAFQRDDIVQDACLRIAGKLTGKEPEVPRASYLWKAAHSAVMDEIRRRRRRREEELADSGHAVPSGRPSPEERSSSAQVRSALRDGLRRLSPGRRAAVVLYLHGFSLKE